MDEETLKQQHVHMPIKALWMLETSAYEQAISERKIWSLSVFKGYRISTERAKEVDRIGGSLLKTWNYEKEKKQIQYF